MIYNIFLLICYKDLFDLIIAQKKRGVLKLLTVSINTYLKYLAEESLNKMKTAIAESKMSLARKTEMVVLISK